MQSNFSVALSGQMSLQKRLETIANNVANASTAGYRAEEVLGQNFSIFYPEEDVQLGRPESDLKIATHEGRYHEETQRLAKGGKKFWADVAITSLRVRMHARLTTLSSSATLSGHE